MSRGEAAAVLGVAAAATQAELRAAYLSKVKEFPPDRDAEAFERVRNAYEALNNPRERAESLYRVAEAHLPLKAIVIESGKPKRKFVGPQAWLRALRGK